LFFEQKKNSGEGVAACRRSVKRKTGIPPDAERKERKLPDEGKAITGSNQNKEGLGGKAPAQWLGQEGKYKAKIFLVTEEDWAEPF